MKEERRQKWVYNKASMNIEQKGVNCTRGCSIIGMLNGFGSQCRSRTDAKVPKGDASSMVCEESNKFFGLLVFSSFKWNGPNSSVTNLRDSEGYKKAASQD